MSIAENRLSEKKRSHRWGNSGIGLAVARLFVAEGAHVAIIGRNQKTLRAAAAELGDAVLAIQVDVTDIEPAVLAAAGKFGKVDILFANTGNGAVTYTPLGLVRLVVRKGMFAYAKAGTPPKKNGGD